MRVARAVRHSAAAAKTAAISRLAHRRGGKNKHATVLLYFQRNESEIEIHWRAKGAGCGALWRLSSAPSFEWKVRALKQCALLSLVAHYNNNQCDIDELLQLHLSRTHRRQTHTSRPPSRGDGADPKRAAAAGGGAAARRAFHSGVVSGTN